MTEDLYTELTVPGHSGGKFNFVLPIKPFHVGSQKMDPPMSSLSDKLLVTTPFIPLNDLLGPCLYCPPRQRHC